MCTVNKYMTKIKNTLKSISIEYLTVNKFIGHLSLNRNRLNRPPFFLIFEMGYTDTCASISYYGLA